MYPGGIVNAASFAGGPVAPGEIVTMFGTNLGPADIAYGQYDGAGQLDNAAADVRVFFDSVQAPLIHALATQVSAIVPYSAGSSVNVRVEYQGRSSGQVNLPVAPTAPGIFTLGGTRHVVALNMDGSLNLPTNPAARGEVVTIFATGEGQTTPGGQDGKLPSAPNWPVPVNAIGVTFAGVPGEVQLKNLVAAGVLQISVKVPSFTPAGTAVPLVLTAGDKASPAAEIAVN